MNFTLLSDPSPKPWCNINCNTITSEMSMSASFDTPDGSSFTSGSLKLLETLITPIPDAGRCVINAPVSQDGRLVVSSQTLGAQTVAYVSDIPPPPSVPDKIESADTTASVICQDLGEIKMEADNVGNTSNTTARLTPTTYTLSQKAGGIDYPRQTVDGVNQTFYSPLGSEKLRISSSGVRINNLYSMPSTVGVAGAILTSNGAGLTTWEPSVIVNPFDQELNTFSDVSFNSVGIAGNYVLPITAGTRGQVLTKGAGVSSEWQTPQVYGLFSQTLIKTVENTIAETSLIGSGVGIGLTFPIGFFQNGYSFVYKTGGQWRTAAVSQSIRFRLRTSAIVNPILFDTGLLLTTNVNTVRGWNIECQFTYYAGTIVTNFTFSYIDANNNTSGFVNRGNTPISNTVSNTIDLTVQWGGTPNILNTITSEYGTLTKIF